MNRKDLDLSQFDGLGTEENPLDEAKTHASRKQMNLIYALFGETGLDKLDFGIPKISKLTTTEAGELIDRLLEVKDEQDAEDADAEDEEYEIGEDLPL